MKKIFLSLFILSFAISSVGQSMFFDDLYNVTWVSERCCFDDASLKAYYNIGLYKLAHSKDSIDRDVTIWNFKDHLTIRYYDYKLKRDSVLFTYKYEANLDKNIMKIFLSDDTSLEYNVGIVSSGFYAILIKKKEKKKRKK